MSLNRYFELLDEPKLRGSWAVTANRKDDIVTLSASQDVDGERIVVQHHCVLLQTEDSRAAGRIISHALEELRRKVLIYEQKK